jgi:hypothetical protein
MEIKEAACARCGAPIDPQNSYWDENGQICVPCNEKSEAAERFLKLFRSTAFGSLGAGMLSLLWNPLFIPTILAISSGVWAFRYYNTSDPQDREVAVANKGLLAAAVVGMILSTVRIIYLALAIAGLLAR